MKVTGECTVGCGECCEVVGVPVGAGYPRFKDGQATIVMPREPGADYAAFLEARGGEVNGETVVLPAEHEALPRMVAYGNGREGMLVVFKSRCPHLTEDKKCDLFGKLERPKVCERYPTVRDVLSIVPKCTYKIEE